MTYRFQCTVGFVAAILISACGYATPLGPANNARALNSEGHSEQAIVGAPAQYTISRQGAGGAIRASADIPSDQPNPHPASSDKGEKQFVSAQTHPAQTSRHGNNLDETTADRSSNANTLFVKEDINTRSLSDDADLPSPWLLAFALLAFVLYSRRKADT